MVSAACADLTGVLLALLAGTGGAVDAATADAAEVDTELTTGCVGRVGADDVGAAC